MIRDDVLCTVEQAAAWFKVSPKTVASWISRYKITASPGRVNNAKRYRLKALAEADFRARQSSGGRPRKSASGRLTAPD